MGLANWFSTFCIGIQVQNQAEISNRYKAITRRLNGDYRNTTSNTSHSLYVGSHGRNTAIHSTSDVDMIYCLPYSVYEQYNGYLGNGQSSLLQAIRNSIKKTYSITNIGADGQVIQIPFTDGITIELVPAFINKNDSYTYPDSNDGGSWKTTNPKPEIEAIRSRNNACNNNLVPLCRMMRKWKSVWSVPMSGLLLDTLAYQFINNWSNNQESYFYYDFMCRDFFQFLTNQDKEQEFWRAPGSAQWVYAGKGQFQYKAKQCFNIAVEAIGHETASPKQEWSAKQKWRSIFGTSFPE